MAKKTQKTTDGAAAASRLGNEPYLDTYTDALEKLHAGDLDGAEKLFQEVAEGCDQPELAERARQLRAATRARRDADADKPSADDPFLLAVYEKYRGNLERALEIAQDKKRDEKDERFTYLVASIHSLEGRTDEAAEVLQKAIRSNDENRVHAFHDPDFAQLRDSETHREIFQLP
jgi:tetratricopeptide (TPR) repeat protein